MSDYDRGYADGQAMMAGMLLSSLLDCLPGKQRETAALALELAEARRVARDLCQQFGDSEWDEDLHLADVLEKHLGRCLRAV